jgi:hypothetical protein
MYITILDYNSGEIHIFNYDGTMGEDFVDIAQSIEDEYDIIFRESECSWMIGELKLQIH